jgi:Zn-dependent peptidase ImmA (M78 family)
MLVASDNYNVVIKELPLEGNNGRICNNKIAIKRNLTQRCKKCTLAEEFGHLCTTGGDILDQTSENSRKQESKARRWAHNKIIGLDGIIQCYEDHCSSLYEMAEFLDVTEEFLAEAITEFKKKYGLYTKYKEYVIYFEPALAVLKLNR